MSPSAPAWSTRCARARRGSAACIRMQRLASRSPMVPTPTGLEAARERSRQLTEGEVTHQSYERPVRRKDGTVIWLSTTFSMVSRDPVRLLGVFQDVTGRVMADRALRESEERFRAVFENSGVGFSIATSEGMFVDCNETFCALVGMTREEVIGRHAPAVLVPDQIPAAVERIRALVAGEATRHSFDHRLVREDGTAIWVNLTFTAMSRDDVGVPTRLLGVLQDITERKKLEDDLRRTKERLELGIRNSGTTIFDLDIPQPELATSGDATPRHGPKATLTLVGWENFGYPADTNITEPDRIGGMLHHPDDPQHADEVTQGYLSGALPKLETEYRIRHADGSYSWRLVRGQALWASRGNPTRMIGSMVDITRRKQMETELRESEQRFRATVENSAVGFASTDEHGVYVDCNETLCRLFGLERDAIVGTTDPVAHDAKMLQLRDGEVAKHAAERRIERADGTFAWTSVTWSVMSHDAYGKADRVLGS